MVPIRTINLQGKVPGGHSFEFLRAETLAESHKPFAHIRYAINGVESKTGLSMDMDKGVFLTHLEDREQEAIAQNAASRIAQLIGEELYGKPSIEQTREISTELQTATVTFDQRTKPQLAQREEAQAVSSAA